MQNDDRLLPVELIHQIFDYLSTIDILQSFSNLNYYFDNILSNYNRYHVNFQSCLKRSFHRIYSRLQSNQILSLVLSNKDDTPNQFQLIFFQWSIEELSHLRAITFIAIENDLLFKFIDTFNNENLQSLTIIPGYYSEKKLPKDSLKKFLVQRLERLDVYNANASCINTQSRYYLKSLTVHDCEIIELQEILSSMPILQSLQVTNHTGSQWINMNKVPIQLKRLALNLGMR